MLLPTRPCLNGLLHRGPGRLSSYDKKNALMS